MMNEAQEDENEQEMLMDMMRSQHSIKQPEDDEEKEDDGSDIALLDNTNRSNPPTTNGSNQILMKTRMHLWKRYLWS